MKTSAGIGTCAGKALPCMGRTIGLCWLGLLLLNMAGCATDAPSAPSSSLRGEIPDPREMVAEVRKAGIATDTELQVTPLRDPQVEDLRARALKLEAQSDIAGAGKAIAQALTIHPGDPELLQQAAEYALYGKDFERADAFATQSYQGGPKLGGLCRRNWTTLRFVRMAHDDAVGLRDAMQHIDACTVAPPARM